MTLKTAPLKDPICLFLVGVQCRSWKSIWKIPYIAGKMGKMIRELGADPRSGLIWGTSFIKFDPFTTLFLSYWKSSDDVHRFVSDPKFSHRKASPDYLKKFGQDANLGVWHETYEIDPAKSENLYLGMAPFGASAFSETTPLNASTRSFMSRLNREK